MRMGNLFRHVMTAAASSWCWNIRANLLNSLSPPSWHQDPTQVEREILKVQHSANELLMMKMLLVLRQLMTCSPTGQALLPALGFLGCHIEPLNHKHFLALTAGLFKVDLNGVI